MITEYHINARLAQNLAASLVNSEVRNFLKEKTVQQFDGDYNFLIENSKEDQITTTSNGRTESVTFGQLLAGASSNSSARQSATFLDSLSELYPLLQVAIPELEVGDAESWNTASDPPLVAFVPSDYDESNQEAIITAYDFEGNEYELLASEEPNQLVIVISENERLIALPKPNSINGRASGYPVFNNCPIAALSAYHESETHLYYFKDDVYPMLNRCSGGGSSGGGSGGGSGGESDGGSGTPSCDRDRKSGKDNLRMVKFQSMNLLRKAESWFAGQVELRAIIVIGSENSNDFDKIEKFSKRKRYEYRECKWFKCETIWRDINAEILTWNKDEIGNRMKYEWIEEDSGIDVDIEISLPIKIKGKNVEGKIKVKVPKKHTRLGSSYVEYCDDTDGNGRQYNTDYLFFKVNQEQ